MLSYNPIHTVFHTDRTAKHYTYGYPIHIVFHTDRTAKHYSYRYPIHTMFHTDRTAKHYSYGYPIHTLFHTVDRTAKHILVTEVYTLSGVRKNVKLNVKNKGF